MAGPSERAAFWLVAGVALGGPRGLAWRAVPSQLVGLFPAVSAL